MFGLDAGFSVPIRGIAAPGDDVVVMDYQGLLRWDGDRFTRLWKDPEPDTVFAESVVGVTADEVWVSGRPRVRGLEPVPSPRRGVGHDRAGPELRRRELPCRGFGFRAGGSRRNRWGDLGRDVPGIGADHGETSQVVTSSGLCPQFAGPDGAVWARAGDEVVLIGPDGAREPIQLPDGTDVCRWAAGVAPAVWISSPVRPPVKDR